LRDNGRQDSIQKLAELYEREKAQMRLDFQTSEEKIASEKSKADSEKEKAIKEATGLKKILSRVNETLSKEHISKEDLIDKMKENQYTILIQKHNESIEKTIRDRLYSLGFKHINSGIYILPPVKAREWGVDGNFDLDKWLKTKLLLNLPKDYKHMINFVSIIDLKKTTARNNLVKRSRTYLDVLEPADLIEPERLIEYLKDKKNISIKDIIQVPNLLFLVDEYAVNKKDYESIKRHNDEILISIKNKIHLDEIKTADLATIDEETLKEALENYTNKPTEISSMIIRNAKFWNNNILK